MNNNMYVIMLQIRLALLKFKHQTYYMIKITTYGGIPNVERGTGGRWMGGGGEVSSLIILLLIMFIQFLYYYNFRGKEMHLHSLELKVL